MPHSRAAVDTIRGYFYQFDYFILKLLETPHDSDTICIEGIEDIDINTADETIAIQCKYYAKTNYNHSVLSKPLCLMLRHYANSLKIGAPVIKYTIYGHYSSGQDKLSDDLDVEFFKKNFFSPSGKKEYEELNLNDKELEIFIASLKINIYAPSYEEQEKKIFDKIKGVFSCSDLEADYYYNNALHVVKRLSTMKNENNRVITKKDFISSLDKKDYLFNIWFAKKRGIDQYCKKIKNHFFSKYNASPYERFFLIDCDDSISDVEIKLLIQNISKKWSKLSKRLKDTFCPYVYLHNITDERLIQIKNLLQSDDFYFIDGYDFKDSSFSVKSICRRATYDNKIRLKVINEDKYIKSILNSLSVTREIYQFYKSAIFFDDESHKHIKIFVEKTNNINDII